MKAKLIKAFLTSLAVCLFWLGVWLLACALVDNRLFLPTPGETFSALLELLKTASFYKAVLFSLLRVLAALFVGIALGIILAFICHKSKIIRKIFYPLFSVIKATPVATFIVLLWILVSGSKLAIIVAILMVMPIVWQNTLDGFKSIPKELVEVTEVYQLPYKKKFRILIMPVLSKYIYPAVITSVGLAWKSEIAAEIIAYTKNSIGMYMNDAKSFMFTPTVFAWTVVIICMSVLLEGTAKLAVRRLKK